jgi:hypothetical protein
MFSTELFTQRIAGLMIGCFTPDGAGIVHLQHRPDDQLGDGRFYMLGAIQYVVVAYALGRNRGGSPSSSRPPVLFFSAT